MSKKHLDQIVVVDLEATCWEFAEQQERALKIANEKRRKEGLSVVISPSEIIEIGACFYNVDTQKSWLPPCLKCKGKECLVCQGRGVVGSFIVKPVYSEINDFCIRLTTLTPEFVKKYGLNFGAACNRFRKYFGPKNRIWGSWGDYDQRMFARECSNKMVNYPFGATHWNIKSFYGIKNKLKKEVGLGSAVKLENLDFEGTVHRGVDDAINTAKVLGRIL